MSEFASGMEKRDTEILHYYNFRNTSVKLVRRGDRFFVITKKYILRFFKTHKSFEFKDFYDAEDMYLALKSMLKFMELRSMLHYNVRAYHPF